MCSNVERILCEICMALDYILFFMFYVCKISQQALNNSKPQMTATFSAIKNSQMTVAYELLAFNVNYF